MAARYTHKMPRQREVADYLPTVNYPRPVGHRFPACYRLWSRAGERPFPTNAARTDQVPTAELLTISTVFRTSRNNCDPRDVHSQLMMAVAFAARPVFHGGVGPGAVGEFQEHFVVPGQVHLHCKRKCLAAQLYRRLVLAKHAINIP
eukprot:9481425-Pyramimonas_sp.AAC.1